jgi:hypothetical protein
MACGFDSADKGKISPDGNLVGVHLQAKAPLPDHLGIVFPALLPGLTSSGSDWVDGMMFSIKIPSPSEMAPMTAIIQSED